jgi:hypothetical protein
MNTALNLASIPKNKITAGTLNLVACYAPAPFRLAITSDIKIDTHRKPNPVRRFFCWALLGWRWEAYR